MKRKASLITVLIIALVGVIFSGYLSYYNLFTSGCSEAIVSCGPNPVEIFGQPTCIYGFFMFLIVAVLSVIALIRDSKRPLQKAIFVFGIIGVLFAGIVAVYEIFFQGNEFTELPACAYGFFLYLGLFIVNWLGMSHKNLALDSHVETELTIPKENKK